jgi:hypothetical protein
MINDQIEGKDINKYLKLNVVCNSNCRYFISKSLFLSKREIVIISTQ